MKTHHTQFSTFCAHEWVLHSEPQVSTSTNRESYLYLGVAWGLNRLINISWLAWFMSGNLQIVTINRASFKYAKVVRSDSSAVPNGVGRPPGRDLLLLQEWWGPQYFEDLKVNNPSFLFLGLHMAWRLFFQWKRPELDLLISFLGRQEETPAEPSSTPQGSLWTAERTDPQPPPWLLGQDPRGSKSIPGSQGGRGVTQNAFGKM